MKNLRLLPWEESREIRESKRRLVAAYRAAFRDNPETFVLVWTSRVTGKLKVRFDSSINNKTTDLLWSLEAAREAIKEETHGH